MKPDQKLWMLLDNATGNLSEAATLAAGPDPVALVLWLDPETPHKAWEVHKSSIEDTYTSPDGRYVIVGGPVFVPALDGAL